MESKQAIAEITILLDNIDNLNDMKTVRQIVQAKYDTLAQDIKNSFDVGDLVTFNHKGKKYDAKISKIMMKNIECVELDNEYSFWKVHPSFLTKVG